MGRVAKKGDGSRGVETKAPPPLHATRQTELAFRYGCKTENVRGKVPLHFAPLGGGDTWDELLHSRVVIVAVVTGKNRSLFEKRTSEVSKA